jgi:hypothetical protein
MDALIFRVSSEGQTTRNAEKRHKPPSIRRPGETRRNTPAVDNHAPADAS